MFKVGELYMWAPPANECSYFSAYEGGQKDIWAIDKRFVFRNTDVVCILDVYDRYGNGEDIDCKILIMDGRVGWMRVGKSYQNHWTQITL